MNKNDFSQQVLEKGHELYRDLPWRHDPSPYRVLVSELMLQQTQVDRVMPKFEAFMQRFPDIDALARAPLADVLMQWQGLGYNRRAKYLHEAAKEIVRLGAFPDRIDELIKMPGIGKNTAGAILAYAFNQPVYYIETNIRTVYLHHFFADKTDVTDTEILAKLQATTPFEMVSPREWYTALMDYGAYLKKQGKGQNQKSKHYKKQSKFEGSLRQMRGQILRELANNPQTKAALKNHFGNDSRFQVALNDLVNDGLVVSANKKMQLAK